MLKNKGHIPFPDLWRIAFVFVHYSILSIKGGPGKSGAVHSAINRKEAGAVINVLKRLLLGQMGSDHPNYLFLFSLYAAYACYFPLNPTFCLQKRDFKIPIPV